MGRPLSWTCGRCPARGVTHSSAATPCRRLCVRPASATSICQDWGAAPSPAGLAEHGLGECFLPGVRRLHADARVPAGASGAAGTGGGRAGGPDVRRGGALAVPPLPDSGCPGGAGRCRGTHPRRLAGSATCAEALGSRTGNAHHLPAAGRRQLWGHFQSLIARPRKRGCRQYGSFGPGQLTPGTSYSFFAFLPPFWLSSESANSRRWRASSASSFGSQRSR